MELKVYDDYQALSLHVADEIIGQVQMKPKSVLCLAAGDTPRLAYELVTQHAAKHNIDFSQCRFVGLDEWLGIPPENEGSCAFFLHHNLFYPLGIKKPQTRLFDSLTHDPSAECRNIDAYIHANGGVDLMVVGVGMNGHIGFNEPGVPENLYAHVIDLDETTRLVGQKYFNQNTELQQGITLGLRHLQESRKVLMIASGTKKADIIRKALTDSIAMDVPASVVRKHNNALIMLDRDAALGIRH